MVDKNLFLYDLAVVAIMKNEEPYVKEWLDYHLLAGVDHFYIYDNDSTPEFKKILQPYIDENIVTYTYFPGKCRQMEAHYDAIQRFRFFSRYIAVIDGDEFIFPKSYPTIMETVENILSKDINAAGVGVNICNFGPNNQEKADYSRDVLERFTACDSKLNDHVSSIFNPRKVAYFPNPHYPQYFINNYNVNENSLPFYTEKNQNGTAEKIVMNHYHFKSREEYEKKVQRSNADHFDNHYKLENFSYEKGNDKFDDSIVKYRDERKAVQIPTGSIEALFTKKQIDYTRIINALAQNIFPIMLPNLPQNFYEYKIGTFLTCLKLSQYLKGNLLSNDDAKTFEELSLEGLNNAFNTNFTTEEFFLLLNELPNILELRYPTVKTLQEKFLYFIPQLMNFYRINN